jgi:hypothetical protein
MTLKRSYIRRKPRRNREPVDWPALQEHVRLRDAAQSAIKLRERLDPLTAARMASQGDLPCVAWVIEGGPIVCGPTKSWRLDHVQENYGRAGRKAEDQEDRLVSLCEVHDERGMKGGAQWNTSHREDERRYLESLYG